MKIFRYKIIETPEEKFCLLGVSQKGDHQPIYVGEKAKCLKILKDIERGHRDTLGCKTIVNKEIEIKEPLDIN